MDNAGVNLSWLWVYGLGAIIGLLAAEVIERSAKALWAKIGPRREKRYLKVQKGQTTLFIIKDISRNRRLKIGDFDLTTRVKKK